MNIKRSIIFRVRIIFLLVVLFGGAAIGRILYLQYAEDGKWSHLAEETDLQYRKVKATRGNIYSDNGSLLATSLPFYRVAFDPTVASGPIYRSGVDSLAMLLSRHFGDYSAAYYKRRINNARLEKKQYIVLNRRLVKYQDKKKMMKWPIFRNGRLKGGVIFEKVDKRFRPFSYLGFRTIGFVNENNQGAGLEYSFNDKLAGKDGRALYQKMAGGKWRPLFDETEVRPVEGLDIETTINVNLQDVTESALLKALMDHDAEYGSAVVMEVRTGEIKAISNLTKYTAGGTYREIYNYAVQGLTEPGSTFKLASMIALFEDTYLSLDDSIDTGDGAYKFFNSVMRDHKQGGYGRISVRHAFEYSSNIGISKMVYARFGDNPDRFIRYLKKMGLMQSLGFQMVGEATPKIKTTDDPSWSGISLPWMSIGYEVELTPLQLLAFYNAVANNGTLIRPLIVKRVRRADKVVETYNTEVLKGKICSDKTLKKIRTLLEGVVLEGTARNIRNPYYSIAGKTGTTQKIKNGRYTRKYYTSFVGYFPADNPKYSCIVVIDEPKGFRQYGSNVAAPVFKEIADMIFAQDLDLHPPFEVKAGNKKGIFPVIRAGNIRDLEFLCSEMGVPTEARTTDEWVRAKRKENAVLWTTDEIAPGVIPNVTGMTLRDAIFLLENLGLEVQHTGHGRVISQSRTPGAKVTKGSRIKLKLG